MNDDPQRSSERDAPAPNAPATPEPAEHDPLMNETARQLSDEPHLMPEQFQSTREESGASTEELRATDEELQSINEEYRSTTEELETSKEELQSINEELETVNAELKKKLAEVSRAHSDLQNLITATEVGTLFLDLDLRIKRFTARVADLFNINESDRGRLITDLSHRLNYDYFVEDARAVSDSLVPIQREVQSADGRWFLMRIRPYRTAENKIDGLIATFEDFKGRRAAEEVLRQSEERHRAIVEGMNEYAIFTLAPDGTVASWNAGAEQILGYTEAEVLGRSLAMFYTEEDRTAGEPAREMQTAEHAGTAKNDIWHLRKDGSKFWASGVMTVLRTPDGSLRGFAKILRDNSERKEAEEALRRSEAFYRTLFDSIEEGLCIVEMIFDESGEPVDYRFVETNPEFEKQTGLTDAVGETARVLLPDLEESWFQTYGRVARTGEPERFTDGSESMGRWFDVYAFPAPGPEPHCVAILFKDVTAQKLSEEALRRSEAHLRRVIDNMLAFVAVTEVDGTLREVNQAALSVAGLTREEVIGKKFWECYWWNYDPGIAERVEDAVRRAAAGDVVQHDIPAQTADGGHILVAFMLAPVRDEHGDIVFLIPSGIDVTERNQAEHALRQSKESLEDRVEERTRQVRALASSLSVAEQDERRRIAHVLHDDLQQLLFGIQLKLTFVHRGALAEGNPTLADHAAESEDLIQRAIQVSRQLTVDISPPVLEGEGLTEALGWLVTQMREVHGLTVEVRAEQSFVIPQEGMRVLLFQIIRELLFNVVKHANTERATVVLEEHDGEIVIQVQDRGDGSYPEALHSEDERGFGLRSIRERLRLFGGHMEIDSVPDEGTHVMATVPLSPLPRR